MPLFKYQAVDAAGEVVTEDREAPTQAALIEELRDRGLMPLEVRETRGGFWSGGLSAPLFGKRRVSQREIGLITQQIASLLRAGLPLDRALSVLISLAEEGEAKKLLTRVQEKVRGGSSLADAMEGQERVFSRFYLNIIRAGEVGGSLEVAMLRLTDFMERSRALKESVTSALIYPTILVVVASLSVIILLTYVIPQFQRLFADAGRTLPLATQIVIGLGEGFRHYWWVGAAFIALIVFWVRRQLSQPQSRFRWDGLFLRLPLVGDLVSKVEMARFSRTLGTLLSNGVALLVALNIAKETMTNQVMAAALNQVSDNLKAGQGLAQTLLEAGSYPKLAVHMIGVGEETGQLQDMLLRVADTYDGEVQTAVKRLLTILEPAIILVLGATIAGLIVSIMVAILSLNDLTF